MPKKKKQPSGTGRKKKRIVAYMPCPACSVVGAVLVSKYNSYSFRCTGTCQNASIFGHILVVRLMHQVFERDPVALRLEGITQEMFLEEVLYALSPKYPVHCHNPHYIEEKEVSA